MLPTHSTCGLLTGTYVTTTGGNWPEKLVMLTKSMQKLIFLGNYLSLLECPWANCLYEFPYGNLRAVYSDHILAAMGGGTMPRAWGRKGPGPGHPPAQ